MNTLFIKTSLIGGKMFQSLPNRINQALMISFLALTLGSCATYGSKCDKPAEGKSCEMKKECCKDKKQCDVKEKATEEAPAAK